MRSNWGVLLLRFRNELLILWDGLVDRKLLKYSFCCQMYFWYLFKPSCGLFFYYLFSRQIQLNKLSKHLSSLIYFLQIRQLLGYAYFQGGKTSSDSHPHRMEQRGHISVPSLLLCAGVPRIFSVGGHWSQRAPSMCSRLREARGTLSSAGMGLLAYVNVFNSNNVFFQLNNMSYF